ncbi:MAG: prepilin peptidase [Alphaproteobacteria bacterium]|nr:prepilin peptidase [Alphaproteobacteria bacterium]
MISPLFLDQVTIVAFLALLAWAAASDFYSYLIPNRISAAVAALFVAHAIAGVPAVDWTGALITGGAVFLVGATMFVFRLVGGGDVKLMSAISLWAGPAQILDFLLLTALAGGLVSLAMMTALRIYRPGPVETTAALPRFSARKQYIPYGIAIAVGGFYVGARLLTG